MIGIGWNMSSIEAFVLNCPQLRTIEDRSWIDTSVNVYQEWGIWWLYCWRSRRRVSLSSGFVFKKTYRGKLNDAWYSICCLSVRVLVRLSVRVWKGVPRPPRLPCLPPLPPRPCPPRLLLPPRPEDTLFTFLLTLFCDASIWGGCFWLTMFWNKDSAWSY